MESNVEVYLLILFCSRSTSTPCHLVPLEAPALEVLETGVEAVQALVMPTRKCRCRLDKIVHFGWIGKTFLSGAPCLETSEQVRHVL